MNGPERLRERGDLVGKLVRSGRSERTPNRTRARALAAAATLTATTAASKVAAGTMLGIFVRGGAARWIIAGTLLVGGTSTVVAVRAGNDRAAVVTPVPAPTLATTTTTTTAAASPPEPVEPVVVSVVAEPAAVPSTPPPATAATSTPPPALRLAPAADAPTPVDASTLGREVAALDEARRAMDADPEAALALLDRYDRTFARGAHLGDEATVLRIKALVRRGDLASARSRLDSFARARPNSPHLPNLRTIVTPGPEPQ